MPAIVKQTSKQAKAAYKARGRPALSETQVRQLERNCELDQRAERIKENEKRRAEAAKRRAENDNKDKANAEQLRLGSQRRYDRFGFKASQFHLNAFFSKPNGQPSGPQPVIPAKQVEENVDQDMFGDDLDDDMLLQVLNTPISRPFGRDIKLAYVSDTDAAIMSPQPASQTSPNLQRTRSAPKPISQDDLSSLWDELDSSTQIARDLDQPSSSKSVRALARSTSFSSGEFDLTAEDLDELDPPRQQPASPPRFEKLTQPPVIPFRRHIDLDTPKHIAHAIPESSRVDNYASSTVQIPAIAKPEVSRLMLPPPLPLQYATVSSRFSAGKATQKPALYLQSAQESANPRPQSREPDAKAMPPPALSLRQTVGVPNSSVYRNIPQHAARTQSESRTHFHAPRIVTNAAQQQSGRPNPESSTPRLQSKPPSAIRGPFLPASSLYCSPDLGFTLSQLENFVDDDLQLTQAMPS